MDRHLLTVWRSVSSGSIRLDELTELLGLSRKQTARYLQKWTKEGWLIFTSGLGRGKASKIQWQKNVEEVYEDLVMKMIDEEPVETIGKYLLYEWSSDSKMRLMNKFHTKFGYNQSTNHMDKLIIPRRYTFLTMHPLEAAEVHSASLVANLFNRLVAIDEKGMVSPELAHSWDVTPTKLRLYLRKDIKFHDASILTAEDVKLCLEKLRSHKHFRDLWEPIQHIEIVAPLVIDIEFPNGCSYCLQLLGTLTSSIYKETKGQLLGTGAFYLEENNDLKTTICAFKDYFLERPLLDAVEFVQVPKDFDTIYRSATQEPGDATFQVESSSGFGVVIMNAFRDSQIQRKEVRDYLHYVIAKHRHEIPLVHSRAWANDKSCLIGHDQQYEVPVMQRPHFSEPLILKGVNYTEKTTMWLKEVFENEGVPVEITWLSFAETVQNSERNQEADLFIHGEVFELNQDLSFYYFLKNGYSPLAKMIEADETASMYLKEYVHTPFEKWTSLNLRMERALLEASLMIPLYYEKRQIPFSTDLMNVNIKHFGYVDFSKLWVRPEL